MEAIGLEDLPLPGCDGLPDAGEAHGPEVLFELVTGLGIAFRGMAWGKPFGHVAEGFGGEALVGTEALGLEDLQVGDMGEPVAKPHALGLQGRP